MGLGRPVDTGVVQLGKLGHLAAPSCQDRGTAGVGALGRLLIAWRSRLGIPRAGGCAPARREPQISCWSSRDERSWRSPNMHRWLNKESHPPLLNLWDLREGSTNERPGSCGSQRLMTATDTGACRAIIRDPSRPHPAPP